MLILTLFSREFSIVDLYNMLFPFVRNTYGILSGIVLGMLTLPLFNKGVKKYENIIKLSLLLDTRSRVFSIKIFLDLLMEQFLDTSWLIWDFMEIISGQN